MNIFKSKTLTWWQVSVFKLSTITFGVAVGAYWHELFGAYLMPLIVVAAVSGLYISYVWLKA